MGTNYYDSILFQIAEEDLDISLIESNEPQYFVTPTTTYAQYKTAVGSAYDSATPLQQKLIDYHMSALTEVVSSGVTTDPDYWSASSVNGTYIINSGLTSNRVGIGTTIPTHTLTVSGTVSASSSLYAGVTDVTNLKIGGAQGSDGQVLTSTGSGVAWEDSGGGMSSFSVDGDNGTAFPITNGETLEFVGQTGIDIGVADPEVRIAMDYNGSDSFIMAATNGTSITVDGANDKLVIYDNDASLVKYINANQLPGGSSSSYWSASSVNPTFIVNSGVTTSTNPNKVGIGTLIPNKELSVSGTVSATTAVYVGTGSGILSGLTFHAPLYSSDYFKSYTGAQSTYFGYLAGTNHSSNDQFNLGVGWKAMGIGSLSGSALKNTAIGCTSLAYIESGQFNTAVGSASLGVLKDGDHNTCIGEAAGLGIKHNNKNTGVGYGTFYLGNAAIGDEPLGDTENTAIGYSSQYYTSEGRWNTSMGSKSLQGNLFTIGVGSTGNTVIGYGANSANTQGSYNTSLGTGVAKSNTTGDYNITIGAYADVETATSDYQLNIGDTIIGKDLVGDNLSINAIGIGTAITNSLLTHPLTVSGDTLINGDLVCSGDIDGGTF